MSELGEGAGREREAKSRSRIDWSRLFVRESADGALGQIRAALQEESAGDPTVGGEAPGWVTDALEAWQAARAQLERMDARLQRRSRELALLQSLGRRAAESRTPGELFATAAEALQQGGELEFVVTLHGDPESQDVRAWVARPVERQVLRDVAQELARFLGGVLRESSAVALQALAAFDDRRAALQAFREEDMVLLPVLRRGRVAAGLAVVHARPPDDSRQRVLYSAANLLSLHLDRILTMGEAERDRFRSILDSMPQAVFLTDPSLKVLQANPAATRILMSRSEGKRDEVRHVGDLDLHAHAAGIASGFLAEFHGEARTPTGEVLAVSLAPVRGDASRVEGLVMVLADVTESRKLHEQLAQAEKMSSLGQMISGVAHELNNPLASILGYAQLLKATASDSALAERLSVVHREARRCQRIVSNLLSFARRHEPERRPLVLNEVVQSVLALMSYQLRVDAVEIESRLDPDLPVVSGDAHQLQQALLNLVTNAHHALRGVEGPRRLRITTGEAAAGVEITVEDSGPGVPPVNRNRVFDPFFTTKAPGEGTGLGLSLVYGAVASHGGSVEVDESPDLGGASFILGLPLSDSREPSRRAEPPGPAAAPDEGTTILVVDDEPTVNAMIRDSLGAAGYRVDVAGSGEEALERLDCGPVDLVLLDFRMPRWGAERLREEIVRRRPALSNRLVLTTGDTVSGDPERFARESAMPLLPKPFELEDLLRIVGSVLPGRGKNEP